MSNLFGFDFTVEFRLGRLNIIADALSRRDADATPTLCALSLPIFTIFGDLRCETDASPELTSLRDGIRAGDRDHHWSCADNLILHVAHLPVHTNDFAMLMALMRGSKRRFIDSELISMSLAIANWFRTGYMLV